AEDGIRDFHVTGVQTCALPILRDGEQSPGASMTRDEKVRIAKALERMRVDVIEAGFPAASGGDFEAVQAVARAVRDSRICALAQIGRASGRGRVDASGGASGST